MEYIKCALCDNKEHDFYRKIDDYRLVKCSQCGLVYLNPRPTQREIDKEYSAEYHINKIIRKELKGVEEIEEEINKNIGRVEEIKHLENKGKLLDIGCGSGFFIACLKKYGWNVSGIDISKWATEFARKKLRLNVITGTVEDVQFNEKFNIVTMYHILEHLPNPIGSLKKVLELIADDGTLIIKGPNLGSFDRIWHGKKWRGYDLPFHLYHFTPKTYQMILKMAGFSVQKILLQNWRLFEHLMEMRLGDGLRTDHPPDVVYRFIKNKENNSIFSKSIRKISSITTRLLDLKGRDLTIYAKKKVD